MYPYPPRVRFRRVRVRCGKIVPAVYPCGTLIPKSSFIKSRRLTSRPNNHRSTARYGQIVQQYLEYNLVRHSAGTQQTSWPTLCLKLQTSNFEDRRIACKQRHVAYPESRLPLIHSLQKNFRVFPPKGSTHTSLI